MHLDTLTEILGISNYKVQSIIFKIDKRIGLYLVPCNEIDPQCSGCGKRHSNVQSTETVSVDDLRLSERKVYVVFEKRKTRCPHDGSIRVEKLDWLEGRVTKRYAEDVFKLTSITTNTEAAWYLGSDDEKVYRIDKRILEEQAKKKLEPIPCVKNISVDEVAWQKWHKYITNVVDADKRLVIWNHKGRGKYILNNFFKKLGPKKCKQIESAGMDGARGFNQRRKMLHEH